jgi:hypothetical protein
MNPRGTGAKNHRIVTESSQIYPPVVIPGCVRSAQTRNPAMIGARFPDLQSHIRGSRGACHRAALSADPCMPSYAPIGASEITPRRDARR